VSEERNCFPMNYLFTWLSWRWRSYIFFHFEIGWRMWKKNTTLKLHLILCFIFSIFLSVLILVFFVLDIRLKHFCTRSSKQIKIHLLLLLDWL